MDRTRGGLAAQAEDLIRLLAAAVNAVRLYPPTSPLRSSAISAFTRDAREVTASHGPVQYRVDRERFIIGETAIGEGLPQIAALSETLHSLQVGQMIVAPGLTDEELSRFLDVIGGDTSAVRSSGGVRSALLAAGVANIAVVEVSLRASSEEGLLGLDLTTAAPEDIARELSMAVAQWGADGMDGTDAVAEAIGRLEPAARDLAMRRCAEALLLLDEDTRVSMLATALTSAPGKPAMDGLLEVVAHMSPAALARLMRLTAAGVGEAPDSLLGAIEFPPELAAELAALLRPSAQSDEQRGVPAEADVNGIAEVVAGADEHDIAYLDTLVIATTARAAAARGLATVLRMATASPSEDAIRIVAEAIRSAAREGALDEVADAAAFLRSLDDDPALSNAVQAARAPLNDPHFLEACARRLADDPGAESARALLEDAGTAGAEALVSGYLEANELQRARLVPTVTSMLESIAPVAGRILRSGEATSAAAVMRLLGAMGSRRLAPTIASGLEHLDSRVREAAVVALASIPGTESSQLLTKALSHWDPETRRLTAREIGRTGKEDLVPALLKIIAEVSLFERNYELKKEVLKSLEVLHSPRAVSVLRRLAGRRLVIGKKNRELRYLARRILDSLE